MSIKAINFPEIILLNNGQIPKVQQFCFHDVIYSNLKKTLDFPPSGFTCEDDFLDFFKKKLPIVFWDCTVERLSVSLIIFYDFSLYSSRFVYDMLAKWLIPGKQLNISFHLALDFKFTGNLSHQYIMTQLNIEVDNEADMYLIKKNIPRASKEIEEGISSYDRRIHILENKNLALDDQVNLIQDRITHLMEKKPTYFDRKLYREMQHFLILSTEAFKVVRSVRHLTRVICWHYLFRRSLGYVKNPSNFKRLLKVRLMPTSLHIPYQPQNVLGIVIGLSYLRENESFGLDQIEKAIKFCLPEVEILRDSFLSSQKGAFDVPIFYLEIKKTASQPFYQEELTKLKTLLPIEFKDRIEQLMNPIFMPRNEEEIMRNILNLNKQLHSIDDIPQIIIQFDKQDETHIVFMVILLRVVKVDEESVQEICSKYQFAYEYIPESIKIVGKLKKRYSKEANVFYVRLSKEGFLRKDHSLDLYKARQSVLAELYRVFKDVRDYNGGMIAKESEVFSIFKERLRMQGHFSEVLLENFFYSLSPVIIRSIISLDLLSTSFQFFLDLLEDERPTTDGYLIRFIYQPHYIFVNIAAVDATFKNVIAEALDRLKIPRLQLIKSFLQIEQTFYFTLVYQSDRLDDRKIFCDLLGKTMKLWQNKKAFSFI